jgi:DNA-binding transcriptional regulator PaaX
MKRAASDAFLERYPVSIAGIIVGIISFQARHAGEGLEPPLTTAMRGLAEAAGFTYGHLRTVLSIWKKERLLESSGEDMRLRWTFGSRIRSVMTGLDTRAAGEDRVSFVIFSFSTEERQKRRNTQEILKHNGFRMFAPNVYVGTGIEAKSFNRTLREFELGDRVFLFETELAGNKPALERIRSLWDLPGFLSARKAFIASMKKRLGRRIADDEQAFFNYQLCSISHHEQILAKAPALPRSCFPADYDPGAGTALLARYEKMNLDRMLRHYRRANREGGDA